MASPDSISCAAPGRQSPGRRFAPLLLFLLVAAVFAPALRNGFLSYDDGACIVRNYYTQQGLGRESIAWAFRNTDSGIWMPLTWLSHLTDATLFGLRPWGHHLTAILLHALNATLLFLVLRRMTGAFWRSLAATALFALHPLRVESVAWVAERKDVLNITFGLASLWCYVDWAQSAAAGAARPARYWWAVGCFTLALLAKPMLVTFPCLLLLLDYWPLQRLAPLGRRLVEKLPFLALTLGFCGIAFWAQSSVRAVQHIPLSGRLGNAALSYFRYLGKTFWPTDLAIFYPPKPLLILWVLLAVLTLLASVAGAYLLRRRAPYLWVGWCWFVGTLVPVIGIIQIGSQAYADRYTYWPSVGLFVALCWGIERLTRGCTWRFPVLATATGGAVLVCSALTWHQLGHWRDNETLFRHTLASTEDNWVAYDNVGLALSAKPETLAEALQHFEAALRILPNSSGIHLHYGQALAQRPQTRPAAIAEFRHAIELDSLNIEAQLGLAAMLMQDRTTLGESIARYRQLVEQHPETAGALLGLGQALQRAGQFAEAATVLEQAVRLVPHLPQARNNLGTALAQLPGRSEEAAEAFREALQLAPDFTEAHFNLGTCLATALGRPAEAIPEYEAVVRARPDLAAAHAQLGLCLATVPARRADAVAELETALRLDPRLTDARRTLERLR